MNTDDQFDQLFGKGAKSIRRDAEFSAPTDADGNASYQAFKADVISYSAEGSIDHSIITGFLHCGHGAHEGIGGQCGEPGCLNVSCKKCFDLSRCRLCLKPLCLEHLRQIREGDVVISMCAHCHGEWRRKRAWKGLFRTLLSPFIQFPKEE